MKLDRGRILQKVKGIVVQNPFTPKTQKALNNIGRLIREWSKGIGIPDPHRVENSHTVVIERDLFLETLKTKDLTNGVDFEIRDDVQFVELITRRKDRFTLVLPEPDAVADLGPGETTTVELPAIYEVVDPDYASTLDPAAPATRTIALNDANYDKFLDPYMAGYCCTQCH